MLPKSRGLVEGSEVGSGGAARAAAPSDRSRARKHALQRRGRGRVSVPLCALERRCHAHFSMQGKNEPSHHSQPAALAASRKPAKPDDHAAISGHQVAEVRGSGTLKQVGVRCSERQCSVDICIRSTSVCRTDARSFSVYNELQYRIIA